MSSAACRLVDRLRGCFFGKISRFGVSASILEIVGLVFVMRFFDIDTLNMGAESIILGTSTSGRLAPFWPFLTLSA